MSAEHDAYAITRQFNALVAPIEVDHTAMARDAYRTEPRPAPEFSQWKEASVLPPGHIALQGDFPQIPDKD